MSEHTSIPPPQTFAKSVPPPKPQAPPAFRHQVGRLILVVEITGVLAGMATFAVFIRPHIDEIPASIFDLFTLVVSIAIVATLLFQIYIYREISRRP